MIGGANRGVSPWLVGKHAGRVLTHPVCRRIRGEVAGGTCFDLLLRSLQPFGNHRAFQRLIFLPSHLPQAVFDPLAAKRRNQRIFERRVKHEPTAARQFFGELFQAKALTRTETQKETRTKVSIQERSRLARCAIM